jgi:hypothetical protein
MSTHDDTSPVKLHGLMRRLLEDHQRIMPHHAHLCPLCQDAERTLDLLAEEVPDGALFEPDDLFVAPRSSH